MAYQTRIDRGNCCRCKQPIKAGQVIEWAKVSRTRNIRSLKHAYAKDCPYIKAHGGDK